MLVREMLWIVVAHEPTFSRVGAGRQAPRQPVLAADGTVIGGPKKLSVVLADALERWYAETERDAYRGDLVRVVVRGVVSLGRAVMRYGLLLPLPTPPHAVRTPLQKAAALLGQMLMEGYGCKADPERGQEWIDKARRKGYRMRRVYCEI